MLARVDGTRVGVEGGVCGGEGLGVACVWLVVSLVRRLVPFGPVTHRFMLRSRPYGDP
jgi:hypothetical protein